MGRDFTAEDDRPGAAPVFILSYGIWKSLLNSNPAVIGQTVRMGGESYTLIGITPANFVSSRETEAWVPLRTAEDLSDHASAFHVIGQPCVLRGDGNPSAARANVFGSGQCGKRAGGNREPGFSANVFVAADRDWAASFDRSP
jgi:hypothetical protein